MLPDSARIQEEDARQANRHHYSRHAPALPLYTENDAVRALERLQPVGYDRPIPVCRPQPACPRSPSNSSTPVICSARRTRDCAIGDKTILFGGDLGRFGRPVLPDPTTVREADILLLESTYGDRLHAADDDGEQLAGIINDASARGGRLIIPAFAIGRVEEVLYWIKRLEEQRRIPVMPVFVDSPMASAALAVLRGPVGRARRRHPAGGARGDAPSLPRAW